MSYARILLCEDDVDHQDLLTHVLREAQPGAEVDVVGSGEEAVRAVETIRPNNYDCVLLDFNLPDCEAPSLLKRLKATEMHAPVLIISADQSQEAVIESVRNGSVDFVPKSEAIRADQLWRRVELAISEHRKLNSERRRIARRNQYLTRLAERDPLTGLYNRRTLDRLFQNCRKTFDRRGNTACILIDLDHFKLVNDARGHAAGDAVLQAAAGMIQSLCRQQDFACRYGGEEFLVIRRGTSFAAAYAWAETFRRHLAKHTIQYEDDAISLTASLGVSIVPSAEIGEDTIRQADEALYLAKHSGRNRVRTWAEKEFSQRARTLRKSSLAPQESLESIIGQYEQHMGPTQCDHIHGHSNQVASLACAIGQALGLSEGRIKRLNTAGRLHDIGKLLIPEAVLAKRGDLSRSEKIMLVRHSSLGAEMLQQLGFPPDVVDLVRLHHIRFEQAVRISNVIAEDVVHDALVLAAADAFSTITSDRTYQAARSSSAAVATLQREAGKQFAPDVVAAMPSALKLLAGRKSPVPAAEVVSAFQAGTA